MGARQKRGAREGGRENRMMQEEERTMGEECGVRKIYEEGGKIGRGIVTRR